MLDLLLQPLAWAWVALWLIAVHLWRARSRRPALAVGAVAGMLTLFGGTPVSAWLLASLERPYVGRSLSGLERVDALVTLGGGHDASHFDLSGLEANSAFDRVTVSMTMLRLGVATNLVLGGGSTLIQGIEHRDGDALAKWLAPHLSPLVRVHVLGHSRNTRDEAVQSLELARRLGWRRLGLVTSADHLSRAMGAFPSEGVEVVPIGCDFAGLSALQRAGLWTIVPLPGNLTLVGRWAHEVVGSIYYRVRGWRGGAGRGRRRRTEGGEDHPLDKLHESPSRSLSLLLPHHAHSRSRIPA